MIPNTFSFVYNHNKPEKYLSIIKGGWLNEFLPICVQLDILLGLKIGMNKKFNKRKNRYI
jgi:hypothetical protein